MFDASTGTSGNQLDRHESEPKRASGTDARASSGTHVGWRDVHEKLVGLSATHAALDCEEAEWLLIARQRGVHRRLGYGSFLEYVERLFGYSSRLVHEKLRVATALENLPLLKRALGDGSASWSSVRD